MKKRICFILLIMITMQLIPAGCIERKTKSGFASEITRDYPVCGIKPVPDNLYMLQDEDAEEMILPSMLFCGLVKSDEDNSIIPALAESWTVDKYNTTYTFRLRDGIYWSDGIVIRANDFLDFFKYIFKPGFSNDKLCELKCISGIQNYQKGKKDFDSVGISARDEKTLVIKLSYPCSNFLNILSQPEYSLKRINSTLSDKDDYLMNWRKNYKNIVSSGPFIIDSVVKDSSGRKNIALVKNKKYWDKDRTVSKKIVMVEEQNCESAMADFDTGNIDLFISPPDSEKERLVKEQDIYISDLTYESYMFFNLEKEGPAADINFRKAINYMISRKDLINKNNEAVDSAKCSYLTESSVKYFGNTDNMEYAKELLQKVKTENYSNLTVIYESGDPSKKIYENLCLMLKIKLDCNINLISSEKNELKLRLRKGDFDIALLRIPDNKELLNSQKGFCTFYDNSDLSTLYTSAYEEKNSYKKSEILNKYEKGLFSDMPFIPVCSSKLVICRNNCITGVSVLKNGYFDLQALYILKRNKK